MGYSPEFTLADQKDIEMYLKVKVDSDEAKASIARLGEELSGPLEQVFKGIGETFAKVVADGIAQAAQKQMTSLASGLPQTGQAISAPAIINKSNTDPQTQQTKETQMGVDLVSKSMKAWADNMSKYSLGMQARSFAQAANLGIDINLSEEQKDRLRRERQGSIEFLQGSVKTAFGNEKELRGIEAEIAKLTKQLDENTRASIDNTATNKALTEEENKRTNLLRDMEAHSSSVSQAATSIENINKVLPEEAPQLGRMGRFGQFLKRNAGVIAAVSDVVGTAAQYPIDAMRQEAYGSQISNFTNRAMMQGDYSSVIADQLAGGQEAMKKRANLGTMGEILKRAGEKSLIGAVAGSLMGATPWGRGAGGVAGLAAGFAVGGPAGALRGAAVGAENSTYLGGLMGAAYMGGSSIYDSLMHYNEIEASKMQEQRQYSLLQNQEAIYTQKVAMNRSLKSFQAAQQMGNPELYKALYGQGADFSKLASMGVNADQYSQALSQYASVAGSRGNLVQSGMELGGLQGMGLANAGALGALVAGQGGGLGQLSSLADRTSMYGVDPLARQQLLQNALGSQAGVEGGYNLAGVQASIAARAAQGAYGSGYTGAPWQMQAVGQMQTGYQAAQTGLTGSAAQINIAAINKLEKALGKKFTGGQRAMLMMGNLSSDVLQGFGLTEEQSKMAESEFPRLKNEQTTQHYMNIARGDKDYAKAIMAEEMRIPIQQIASRGLSIGGELGKAGGPTMFPSTSGAGGAAKESGMSVIFGNEAAAIEEGAKVFKATIGGLNMALDSFKENIKKINDQLGSKSGSGSTNQSNVKHQPPVHHGETSIWDKR